MPYWYPDKFGIRIFIRIICYPINGYPDSKLSVLSIPTCCHITNADDTLSLPHLWLAICNNRYKTSSVLGTLVWGSNWFSIVLSWSLQSWPIAVLARELKWSPRQDRIDWRDWPMLFGPIHLSVLLLRLAMWQCWLLTATHDTDVVSWLLK